MLKTGIIILAAGASSRMGQPKQLLPMGDTFLLKHVIDIAMQTSCFPVVVVLGANKKHIVPKLDGIPVTLIDNPHWASGMASSLKMGIAGAYITFKDLDALVFLTCDQPHISPELIENLKSTAEQNPEKLAVATQYQGTFGIPALIKRPLFNDLLDLKEEEGAKKILMQHKEKTAFISFELGGLDLDTMQEYQTFLNA